MATALLVALVLAGCTGGATPTGAPASGTSGPSSSGTSDAATPDQAATTGTAGVPTPPSGPDTPAGRRAFARYVLQAWVYALGSNDAGPLVSAGRRGRCGGCAALERELSRRADRGWSVALPAVAVRGSSQRRGGRTTSVTLDVDIPAGSTRFDDGRFRSSTPAHPGTRFVVEVARTPERFVLVSYGVR